MRWKRSVYRLPSTVAAWASRSGSGLDGAVPAADCTFGGVEHGEHNTRRMATERDLICAGALVALTPAGRKGFFRAYELRMDSLVTYPLFEYRVSYRRLLEIQVRLLARVIEGEIATYPVFVTR